MKTWLRISMMVMVLMGFTAPAWSYEVVVLPADAVIDWLKAEDWWGEEKRGEQLMVPRLILTGISERWQKNAANLPVSQKKGIIRVNHLDLADNTAFRDEPMRFILTTADEASAAKLRKDIAAMQKSGEIEKIVQRMRLE